MCVFCYLEKKVPGTVSRKLEEFSLNIETLNQLLKVSKTPKRKRRDAWRVEDLLWGIKKKNVNILE